MHVHMCAPFLLALNLFYKGKLITRSIAYRLDCTMDQSTVL